MKRLMGEFAKMLWGGTDGGGEKRGRREKYASQSQRPSPQMYLCSEQVVQSYITLQRPATGSECGT